MLRLCHTYGFGRGYFEKIVVSIIIVIGENKSVNDNVWSGLRELLALNIKLEYQLKLN